MPLPPYIAGSRAVETADRADYQTIYAAHDGAVAAPTAGLHFTPELMAALEARGIARHFVTLHVGAGTFLPVKADDTADHKMHFESGEISAETAAALNAVRARGGRIVAVGTTSLRLLEAAARSGELPPFKGATDIFITPGYRFRAVDILMTNFHLPRSTLFMLVAAFAGLERMQAAYEHAIAAGYRFYSYGDASLLFPSDQVSYLLFSLPLDGGGTGRGGAHRQSRVHPPPSTLPRHGGGENGGRTRHRERLRRCRKAWRGLGSSCWRRTVPRAAAR